MPEYLKFLLYFKTDLSFFHIAMSYSEHDFLSNFGLPKLELFDCFALKLLSKREVVIQDCEYTGIVFSDRAKSIFFEEPSHDGSNDLYLNTNIVAHCAKNSLEDVICAHKIVFSVIYNKRAQSLILKADRENIPYFVSPEYENALFVIAKKNLDYYVFVEKSYSKIKMLLEKLSLATSFAEYVKL
jgi:hypothetical protein